MFHSRNNALENGRSDLAGPKGNMSERRWRSLLNIVDELLKIQLFLVTPAIAVLQDHSV
jgi:hypothetical protein